MVKNKFHKILLAIKEHWLILFLAFVGGILIALPTVSSVASIGLKDFKGVFPVFNSDKTIYMTMTKEILDGHPGLGNPFLKEHKDMPFMYPPVSEMLLAVPSLLFGISMPVLFAINDFVLPFVEILLLYFLFFKISHNKILSVFFAFFFAMIFAPNFAMPINPQLSFMYLTAGVIIIWLLTLNNFEPKKCFKLNVALSIPFLLAFYTYPYFWTGILVLYGVNLLFFLIERKSVGDLFRNVLPFFVITSLFSIPYFINMYKAVSTGLYAPTMARLGLYSSHIPACFTNVTFILFVSFVLLLFYKFITDKRKLYFSISLLLSAILLNWQNVVTGKTIQFSSHYFQLTIFYCLIAVFVIIYYLIKNRSEYFKKINFKKILVPVLLLIFMVTLLYKKLPDSMSWFSTTASKSTLERHQNYGDVFEWLNKNTEPDSAIFTANNSEFNLLIPSYTRNNVLHIGYSSVYLMTDEEAELRWMVSEIFNDDIDEEYFRNGNVRILVNKYVNEFQNAQVRRKLLDFLMVQKGDYDNKFLPDDVIEKFIADNKRIRNENLGDVLKYFEIDYIVIDKNKDNTNVIKEKIEKTGIAKFVDEVGGMIIYKII